MFQSHLCFPRDLINSAIYESFSLEVLEILSNCWTGFFDMQTKQLGKAPDKLPNYHNKKIKQN